jgi:hypothetical protein
MYARALVVTAAVLPLTILAATQCLSDDFQLECPAVPFSAPSERHPAIDDACGMTGDQTDGPKAVQNSLKNNLCSERSATTLQPGDFVTLQRTAEQRGVPFGFAGFAEHRVEHIPDDRTPLANLFTTADGWQIGEGARVQIVALIDFPHYADTSSGESVNCKLTRNLRNDIHINLVQTPAPERPKSDDPNHDAKLAERNAALCDSITAEIIPHFRPAAWEVKHLQQVEKMHLPVRIAGQLFFDASHFPCTGTTSVDSLKRATLWEIHPVYAIDVCQNGSIDACASDDESVWTPLHQWIESPPSNATSVSETEDDGEVPDVE